MQDFSPVQLGYTPLTVSRLSFGTVFMGPRADDLSPEAGAELLRQAFRLGVTCWDTSEDYGTQPHIARALKDVPRDQVVVSSKLNLPAGRVENVLEALGTSYLDILLVHEVTLDTMPEAKATLQAWRREKSAGKVRALGLSTHSAQVASAVQAWPEVEVLMLPINAAGLCLPGEPIGGGIELMKAAAERAWLAGNGIVAMKVMGGGALANQAEAAISHVAQLPYVHSLCIGMRKTSEIEQNAQVLGARNCMPGASAGRATKPCFS